MEENQELQAQEKIINVDIEREMKKSFLDYSMSVIVSRALPDVRGPLLSAPPPFAYQALLHPFSRCRARSRSGRRSS